MPKVIKPKAKGARAIHPRKKKLEQPIFEPVVFNPTPDVVISTPEFTRPILENSFKEYVQHQRLAMHYSLAEIAERLHVREEHLQLLEEEGLNRILPEVYVYSILKKYCNFLHLDYEQALKLYKNEVTAIKLPGETDSLTTFRDNMAHKISLNYRKLIIGFLLVVVLAFGGYQLDMLVGKPSLMIKDLSENMQVSEPFINIIGTVARTQKLLFNGQEILLDNGKNFQVDNYNLTNGWNTLKFEAYNHLGRATIKEYHIEFIGGNEVSPSTTAPTTVITGETTTTILSE